MTESSTELEERREVAFRFLNEMSLPEGDEVRYKKVEAWKATPMRLWILIALNSCYSIGMALFIFCVPIVQVVGSGYGHGAGYVAATAIGILFFLVLIALLWLPEQVPRAYWEEVSLDAYGLDKLSDPYRVLVKVILGRIADTKFCADVLRLDEREVCGFLLIARYDGYEFYLRPQE